MKSRARRRREHPDYLTEIANLYAMQKQKDIKKKVLFCYPIIKAFIYQFHKSM